MSFRLPTVLWAFALLAAALATFGAGGILAALAVMAFWGANRLRRPTGVEWIVLFVTLGLLLALLLPASWSARESARRIQCMNRMHQVAIALLAYATTHPGFPLAASPGENGAGPMSWRIPILPMLEQKSLYDAYRRDEAWDGVHNSAVSQYPLDTYSCPSDPPVSVTQTMANYLAIVGPQTVWPPDHEYPLDDIKDGASKTILLIEVAGRNTPWAKPEDLSFDEAVRLLTSPSAGSTVHVNYRTTGFFYKSDERPGLHVAFADGTVRFLALPLSKQLASALLTVDGGESIDEGEFSQATEPQLDYAKCYAFAAFVLLALWPGRRMIFRRRPPADHQAPTISRQPSSEA